MCLFSLVVNPNKTMGWLTSMIVFMSLYVCCHGDDEIMDHEIEKRVHRIKRAGDQPQDVQDLFKNLELKIATIPSAPYVYFNNNSKIENNERYTGFVPDMIFELSQRLGFKYEFYIPTDQRYGTKKSNATQWTGMIGDVIRSQNTTNLLPGQKYAHMAATDITITKIRSEAVDFLHAFANVGLTVMIQKPHRKNMPANVSAEKELLYFDFNFDVFKPLSAGVWVMVTIFMIVVWLFTWLMNLYNPYEYGERYKRNLSSEEESRLFNLTGSAWYTFTILQWQGYDRAPRSVASKMLGCIWMVFVTVTLITYIGSFVNYLFWSSMVHGQVNPLVVPLKDLRDLVNHHDGYTYGCVSSGSTYQYITKVARGAEFTVMKKYWEGEGKDQLVNSSDEGVKKARNEKFAFILETPKAKHYASNRPCDMMQTGIEFGKRSYGMAVAKMSPIREPLHNELIEMMELGVVEELENRWFDDHNCFNVTVFEKAVRQQSMLSVASPKRVTVSMFWSPLVIMILGIVASMLVALAEIFWYKYRGRYDASNRQRGHQLTNEDDGHI